MKILLKNINFTQQKLAEFLETDYSGFSNPTISQVNPTYIPRFKELNQLAKQIKNSCLNLKLHWVVNSMKTIGFHRIIQLGGKKITSFIRRYSLTTQGYLCKRYRNLEKMLDINLDLWRV